MPNKKRSPLLPLLTIAVVGLVAYFIYSEIQTRLGKEAFASTGLSERSLEEAQTLAGQSGKLVLADLSAYFCPTCRKLDREILANEQVQSVIDEHYIFARVDYESEAGEAFMERYGIRGFPTVLALAPNGNLVERLPLAFDPSTYAANLKAAAKRQEE